MVCSLWKHKAVLRNGEGVTTSLEHKGATQYGAGAKTVSKNTGIDIETVKRFIEGYYSRYSGVKAYQEMVKESVETSRKPSAKRTEKGVPAGVGFYQSPSGRKYTFREYDAPEWLVEDKTTTFSPTQMKNYAVQGFSTGDIVPMILGTLYRALNKEETLNKILLPVNTIHDSILFDLTTSLKLKEACRFVKAEMEKAPLLCQEKLGIDFDLPLNVEVKYGKTWDCMTVCEL